MALSSPLFAVVSVHFSLHTLVHPSVASFEYVHKSVKKLLHTVYSNVFVSLQLEWDDSEEKRYRDWLKSVQQVKEEPAEWSELDDEVAYR